MIKKKQVEVEKTEDEKFDAIEQAISITEVKLNKLYTKKANLEMDIDSLVLSLSLLQKELENGD